MRLPADNVNALLVKHGIHAPVTDERYLRHADVERGVALKIICWIDPAAGRQIAVSSGGKRSIRTFPLSATDAEAIVSELESQGAALNTAAERHMLARLLHRTAELFFRERLQRFYLAGHLRSNDYRVGHAAMSGESRLSVEKRLAPHAHDTGAVFAHRPTDRRD